MYQVLLLLGFCFSLPSLAQTELDRYIQLFSLTSLPEVSQKNEALYHLGIQLFHDKKLSGKNNVSCSSCHAMKSYSADGLPLGLGEGATGLGHERTQDQGDILPRSTPPLFNLGLPGVTSLFWDGRVGIDFYQGGWRTPEWSINGKLPLRKTLAETFESTLALQSVFPISNPQEMLGRESSLSNIEAWDEVMERLLKGNEKEKYQKLFKEAFPGVRKFNIGHVGNALAEYQRHDFLSNNTLWDQYLRGRKEALSLPMKRGAQIFLTKASCVNCHTGEHLSTFAFLSIGTPQIGQGVTGGDDKGRTESTGVKDYMYQFRVPPIRNVALTAPYMHSGAFNTLWEVIDHYNDPINSLKNFKWNPRHPNYRQDLIHNTRDDQGRIEKLAFNLKRNLNLSETEKKDLFCFLYFGLTDQKFQKDLVTEGHEFCSPVTK